MMWLCCYRRRYKLRVLKEPDLNFFKDQGGNTKCLEATVALMDGADNPVRAYDCFLRPVLLYEGSEPSSPDLEVKVSNQDICKILNVPLLTMHMYRVDRQRH